MLLLMCTRATPSIVYEPHNYPHSEAWSSGYSQRKLNRTGTIDMEHYEFTAMDDITKFQPTESHKEELLDEDKANHDSDTRILQPGLAPKVLFFLVLNACSSRNQNYKVVASFSTTKTEVFAETNCCSSLRGQ
ncbi:hypothetical protein C5167_032321 [Papaver somniferum]|uniref:Uncharacterized protein n=1 Tax=Papaver somniferum TaxID=3469 RepID=A0A4Y7K788_PAPSO|nr:uncharacterized protein LOC113297248 [Papaver somniferum]XP_026401462.1 uncharacterized protein LOC113297248 [Papaver somniferum]XP_026401463.1 uncharacterized protein LOC113297248 [Papaver somniferum]RZC69214.1 hypothetical protein C5167_032321 [Papaver somniferum]